MSQKERGEGQERTVARRAALIFPIEPPMQLAALGSMLKSVIRREITMAMQLLQGQVHKGWVMTWIAPALMMDVLAKILAKILAMLLMQGEPETPGNRPRRKLMSTNCLTIRSEVGAHIV